MVAANYTEGRRAMAHNIGLGRKAGAVTVHAAEAAADGVANAGAKATKSVRKSAMAAKEAAQAHLGG
jgi:hypothetical protein